MQLPGISPPSYRRITLIALLALGFIVVTGAGVRLTGSGLGCPSWPNCEPGSLTPRDATSTHAMIEFVNRTITGAVSVAVMLAVGGSLLRRPRRRDLTWWSWSLVAGVLAQIVLGGLTVIFDLAPPFVMGHFLVSAVLVGCAVVLHHRAGQPDGSRPRAAATAEVRLLARIVVGLASIVLVTGTAVTGAGPHGGDEAVERLDLLVPDIARVHAAAVWLLLAATVWTFVQTRRGGASTGVAVELRRLIVVLIGQGAVGYAQYALGVPEGLVAVHVLGSMVVWGAAVRVLLSTTAHEPGTPPGGDQPDVAMAAA